MNSLWCFLCVCSLYLISNWWPDQAWSSLVEITPTWFFPQVKKTQYSLQRSHEWNFLKYFEFKNIQSKRLIPKLSVESLNWKLMDVWSVSRNDSSKCYFEIGTIERRDDFFSFKMYTSTRIKKQGCLSLWAGVWPLSSMICSVVKNRPIFLGPCDNYGEFLYTV